jgi:hypothetical protein
VENDSAFLPSGLTYAITAAVTPPTPVQIGGPASGSPVTVKIFNSGTVFVTMAYGQTAAAATANCVTPTTGSPTQSLIIPPGADETFTVPPAQFWTGLVSAATAVVYLQTGYGI